MKRKRRTLLALVCALLLSNTALVFAAEGCADTFSSDYPGNVKSYAHSFITESGWGMHRGRSYVALTGNDTEYLTEQYTATSSIGSLAKLGRNGGWGPLLKRSECSKHWYFKSVKTTLETDNSKITAIAD